MSGLSNLVGTRELSLSSGGKVTVSLGAPFFRSDGEFHCSYRILGLKKDEEGRAIGSDALQALQLALTKVGTILYTSPEWQDRRLSWDGDRNLGFPLPDSIKDIAHSGP